MVDGRPRGVQLVHGGRSACVTVDVNYDSDVPPYQQVAGEIIRLIKAGELKPGDRVPSVARLMQEYGIARTTAGKVLSYLRDEGWIVIRVGWGSFVSRERG